jgi:hypothetical protein
MKTNAGAHRRELRNPRALSDLPHDAQHFCRVLSRIVRRQCTRPQTPRT